MVNILIEIIALTNMHLIFLFLVPMVVVQLMQLKNTSDIYEIPFIGMSNEEAVFKNKTFSEFIEGLT